MTQKPRKYNGMVGGPDVQKRRKEQQGCLTESTNPG